MADDGLNNVDEYYGDPDKSEENKKPNEDKEEALIRQIRNLIVGNTTAKKLFTYLNCKGEYHTLIENSINDALECCVHDIENTIEIEFKNKCKPILDRVIPFPANVLRRSDRFLERLADGNNWYNVAYYTNEIQESTLRLLNDGDDEGEHYAGLESDRDTLEEVENISRMYSETLDNPPKMLRCNSLRTVAFVPTILQLRNQLCTDVDDFDNAEKKLSHYKIRCNTLKNLVVTPTRIGNKELFEDRCVIALRSLGNMGLLKNDDVYNNCLLHRLCNDKNYFAERRFRLLVELCPKALIKQPWLWGSEPGLITGWSPLHYVACHNSSIKGFCVVMEAAMQYYPHKKGINLLFCKTSKGSTPFYKACSKFGQNQVLKVIESVLINASGNPYDTTDAFVLAAMDSNVELDGVFFLLRKNPDVLQKLLMPIVAQTSSADDVNEEKGIFLSRTSVDSPPKKKMKFAQLKSDDEVAIIGEISSIKTALIKGEESNSVMIVGSKEISPNPPKEKDMILVKSGPHIGVEGELVCIDGDGGAIVKDLNGHFKIIDFIHLGKIAANKQKARIN